MWLHGSWNQMLCNRFKSQGILYVFCFEMVWAHIVKRYNLQLNFDGVYFFQNHTYVADELCMYCIVGNGRSTTGILTNEWPSCRIQCDQTGNDNHICICWEIFKFGRFFIVKRFWRNKDNQLIFSQMVFLGPKN